MKSTVKVPKGKKRPQNNMTKNVGFVALLVLFALIIGAATNSGSKVAEISFSEVQQLAQQEKIDSIIQTGNDLDVTLVKPIEGEEGVSDKRISRKDTDTSLSDSNVITQTFDLKIKEVDNSSQFWMNIAFTFLPMIFLIGFFYYIMKQAQGQGNQAMNFGKSKAKIYGGIGSEKIQFKDVAGNRSAKQDLQEVVEFLKFPKKYKDLGAKIPTGVLLIGPPGTGKTMLAKAVANEAGVPFFSISGSEFVEMFVGVGASRVRDLFAKAKKNAPCIIFIDEIDAVGRKRGSGMGGGHDEREQTLNQILVEMDGFEQGSQVIVLAATNRADVLDPALLRPGRFDRRVQITLPDRQEREEILHVHFDIKPAKTIDIKALSAKTAGSSGADLANIANESAIVAARNNAKSISDKHVTEAFEKVAIGPERKHKIMSEKEKELTAYHEAGHAIVGHVLPDSDLVHKVTIIPRGGTGGVTWFIPEEDKSYHSIIEYKDVLARMLGGRVAEKIIYGVDRVTTGAGNDLQKATDLAREMVIEQGMGETLRDQVFHQDGGGMMFDRMVHDRPYSEETAKEIDGEVEKLIKEAARRAEEVIKSNKKYLDKLKDALLEKETLEAKEVITILTGTKMPKVATLY